MIYKHECYTIKDYKTNCNAMYNKVLSIVNSWILHFSKFKLVHYFSEYNVQLKFTLILTPFFSNVLFTIA